MIKIVVAAIAFVSVSFIYPADPLKDTKWATEGFMVHFTSSDTVKVYAESELILQGIYMVKDSLLSWKDLSGGAIGCDTSITGNYIYKINDNVLSFAAVQDDCDGRKEGLEGLALLKQ